MIISTYCLFFIGNICFIGAVVGILVYLFRAPEPRLLNFVSRLTLLGAVLLGLTLALRGLRWRLAPFAGEADSLTLFILLVAAIAYAITRSEKRRALLTFYIPPVTGLAIVCAALAIRALNEPPRELPGLFLVVHVGLAFLAYALFFIASVTSVAYVYQSHQLKRRRTTGLFQKLPSLENLDHTLYLLIKVGYPLFVITLVLGAIYARLYPDPLSPTWWWSPKILLSVIMVIFYALSFHLRWLGLLRGPKLAYLVFIGFGAILAVYLLLEVFQLKNYNFYGGGG